MVYTYTRDQIENSEVLSSHWVSDGKGAGVGGMYTFSQGILLYLLTYLLVSVGGKSSK